ncbi:hypothetical protein PHJA_002463900 [Phtheirospermum japonicum]|uniref:Uncharacterized protein n=1 Tax=Phtheirospermum japonicum TaxID=374723 RepID=A0A830CTL3_9LAMI|nr:hypothetical protein PHJA_002463900 [Phtheirospermum japonicum]
MAIIKFLTFYFCLISILTLISNPSDAAVVPTEAVARNLIRGSKLPASETIIKTLKKSNRVDSKRDCREMDSRSDCGQNPKCRWCRSDALDDTCFSKSESFFLFSFLLGI